MLQPDYNETPEGFDLPFDLKIDLAVALVLLLIFLCIYKKKRKKRKKKEERQKESEKATSMTLKQLRSCDGFEGIKKKEGKILIDCLEQISIMSYELLCETSKVYEVNNDVFPLKGIVKDSESGAVLTGYRTSKGYYYYKANAPKVRVNRSQEKIHELFVDELKKYEVSEKFIGPLKKQLALLYNRFNVGNPELFIKKSLELCYPFKLWVRGNYSQKRKLQNLMFPNGVWFDAKNNQYLVLELNSFFAVR